MFTPQSLLSFPGKSSEHLLFRKSKGMLIRGTGSLRVHFLLSRICFLVFRKLVLVVIFFFCKSVFSYFKEAE